MEILNSIPLPIILIVIAVILASIVAIVLSYLKQKNLNDIRKDVYKFILDAEHEFKEHKENEQKLSYVIQKARSLLPGWLQFFLTEERMKQIIDTWFKEVKDLLDDGKVNGSQDQG